MTVRKGLYASFHSDFNQQKLNVGTVAAVISVQETVRLQSSGEDKHTESRRCRLSCTSPWALATRDCADVSSPRVWNCQTAQPLTSSLGKAYHTVSGPYTKITPRRGHKHVAGPSAVWQLANVTLHATFFAFGERVITYTLNFSRTLVFCYEQTCFK